MTGFGRAEAKVRSVGPTVVEIHTLNHRFLELDCRLPEGFQSLEDPIRAMVGQKIRRGRVRLSVSSKGRGSRPELVFQTRVAMSYVRQLRRLQRQLGISGEVTLPMILGLPQVMAGLETDAVSPPPWSQLKGVVALALDRAIRMRRQEGRRLTQVLSRLVATVGRLKQKICKRVPAAERDLVKRISARIQALTKAAGQTAAIDPSVLVAEAASLVQATDVSEELARIDSHLAGLRRAIAGRSEGPGRTIDFLAQELNREVNTIGSKIRDALAVRWVVALKNQIEKIREQAANVE